MFRLGPKEQVAPPDDAGAGTCEHHHPKSDVPVRIVRVVPVAIGTPHVPVVVVERAAPQHTEDIVSRL
jgi:hypothetical protein